MPLVDGSVVLSARIGANPRGPGDAVPEITRLDSFGNFPVDPSLELPIAICFQDGEKLIGNAHAVIGVLSRNGLIRPAVPVGIVFVKDEMREPLLRIGKHPLNVGLGNVVPAGR